MTVAYGFGKVVDGTFDAVVERTVAALKDEGFGVLTEIDVAATLEKKIGAKMPPYRILGACNPPLAHQAVMAEPEIGLLLPCNVLVRQDDAGAVHVDFMDPNAVLKLVDRPEIVELAGEVTQKLQRVMAAL